jgi:2-polyprenyl-6-methoxyphenol hydroxylase-like FAD-dependent oxidoreductase
VLRRYERWRKSENTVALGLIDGLNRLFSTSDATLTWARRLGLTAVDRSALAKRFFIGRAMGTSGELPQAATRGPRTS